jgi:glyoxylase-like metal-dependent hydrolase (beta-lactamase superfamily II)
MSAETRTIGSIDVTAILDADLELDPITDAFPDIPPDALVGDTDGARSVRTQAGNWRLRVRAWLIRHDQGLILVDTGIGGPTSPTQAWVPQPGALLDRLAEEGTSPEEIPTVVITHVHDDHVGGLLAASGEPAFANARHVLQRADLEWQRALGREDDDERAIWDLLAPLETGGMLDVIDGDHAIAAGIELHHLPGHTPGHQVLRIRSGSARLTISADTWNHPLQLEHPEWPSGPDNDHTGAAAARRALRAELAAQPGAIIAPTHFGEPFVSLDERDDGPVWVPA